MMSFGTTGGWIWMMIMGVVFCLAILTFIVLMVTRVIGPSNHRSSYRGSHLRKLTGVTGADSTEDLLDPLELAKKRLAQGEMTPQEYDEISIRL
ncbi:MAG: hypothetical protein M1483_02985 [Actinobacteria bacterium]|nr:hypothetical protein [Actinomycetota bacterium]MCL6104589.1 hypothetical protein [Actinomycetota bacterium]